MRTGKGKKHCHSEKLKSEKKRRGGGDQGDLGNGGQRKRHEKGGGPLRGQREMKEVH